MHRNRNLDFILITSIILAACSPVKVNKETTVTLNADASLDRSVVFVTFALHHNPQQSYDWTLDSYSAGVSLERGPFFSHTVKTDVP